MNNNSFTIEEIIKAMEIFGSKFEAEDFEFALNEYRSKLEEYPKKFTYYLHDNLSSNERQEELERQGIVLSADAWENFGRPFYEVTLECKVDKDGNVTLLSAKL